MDNYRQDLQRSLSNLLKVQRRDLRQLCPLETLWALVRDWSPDRWKVFWAYQIEPFRSKDPKWAATLDCWVELDLRKTDYTTPSLALAVLLGGVVTFVVNPVAGVGFAIERSYWSLMNLEPEGVQGAIERSVFHLPAEFGRRSRLAQDLTGYPLYTDAQTLRDFGRRPISGLHADKATKTLIYRYVRDNPGKKMRKSEFVNALCERDDRISKSMAQSLWRVHTPAEWKLAGTKSGSPGLRQL